jgi:chemotaxis protein MotA
MRTSVLGVLAGIFILWKTVSLSAIGNKIFLDEVSILIVIGGTLSSGIITYGLFDMFRIFKVSTKVFLTASYNINKVLAQAFTISEALDENPSSIKKFLGDDTHPFFKDGLRLIQNESSEEEIEAIMVSSLENRYNLQMHHVDMLRTLSKYPPAFGMIGTVIGLVGVLTSIGTGASNLIGVSMATALMTTLYGLIVANFVLTPLSDNLLHRLSQEVTLRKLIIEAVLLIKKKEDPLVIKEYLQVYIQPNERMKLKLFERQA